MSKKTIALLTLSAIIGLSGCSLLRLNEAKPQLTPAKGASLLNCTQLNAFSFPNTAVTTARLVETGTLKNAGQSVDEHCLVTGKMNQRVSQVDGQTYAIAFEMRLPRAWWQLPTAGHHSAAAACRKMDCNKDVPLSVLMRVTMHLKIHFLAVTLKPD